MKALTSLVRLYKWRLDEKRRQLAELYAIRDGFENRLKEVDATVLREQNFVNSASESQQEMGNAYGAFAQAAIMQRENLHRSIHSLEAQLQEALEEVGEAFKALKRQEIAAANQEARKTKARDRREQIASDDQSIDLHLRKISRQ